MSMPGQLGTDKRQLDLRPRGYAATLAAVVLLALGTINGGAADAKVKTLAGGRISATGSDAGFSDGDGLQMSQFNTPMGCAIDASGRVYVADRNNGALRRLDVAANTCRTLVTGLNQPVAVVVDKAGLVYTLTAGDGVIHKLDRGVSSTLAGGFASPTALAYDLDQTIFVTEARGDVMRVNLATGLVTGPVLTGLYQPMGIAVLDSGLIAISESGISVISLWDPQTGGLKLQVGSGSAGFADGPATAALLNQPQQLAKASAGNLIVADRGNQRVRLIDASGFVSTIYGVDPALWEGPACTSCNPIILPGWFDGSVEFAEAREPVGVTVGPDGSIYTTEDFYHLVRQISGVTFGSSDGTSSNPLVVLPPTFDPVSGYYPMGQTITVSDPNTSSFLSSVVYYSVDGTEPTTNSFRLDMTENVGTILWQEKSHDLSSLRLKAFLGSTSSDTVSGQTVTNSEIGVPQDMAAGVGSVAIIPIVVNLRTNEPLKSLQYRIEITPDSPSTPVLTDPLQALSISTNDFIPVYTGGDNQGTAVFQATTYSLDRTRGLAVTFIGTNANFSIKQFGVAGMVAVRLPAAAKLGDRYRIDLLNPSGTADAAQQRITLVPMASHALVVAPARYLVGDSSTATWYNAAQFDNNGLLRPGFGDGQLDNSDVNNAFAAATGLRVPYPNTDLFDALDAFPEDTVGKAGGDGVIRYLDWQIILLRSLGLDLARWERTWSETGVRLPIGSTNQSAADSAGQTLSLQAPGDVWTRQVKLSAQLVENVVPGVPFDIPVYVKIAPGSQLAGLAFRVTIEPDGAAPALELPVKFIPSPDEPAPPENSVPNVNTALCGWPLVPSSLFDPALQGSNVLGRIRVTLPLTAQTGQSYSVRFANADGSPDLQTQYDFDTQTSSVWVLSPALHPSAATSDDWKVHFFGSASSDAADDNADPDHDGVPNWAEYLAGTDPTNPQSNLHLESTHLKSADSPISLRWLSAPGVTYQLESTDSLANSTWTVLATDVQGDGSVKQWSQTKVTGQSQFFRIRLKP